MGDLPDQSETMHLKNALATFLSSLRGEGWSHAFSLAAFNDLVEKDIEADPSERSLHGDDHIVVRLQHDCGRPFRQRLDDMALLAQKH